MKRLFWIAVSLVLLNWIVFASNQSIAEEIAGKLIVKITDKTISEKISFLTTANRILEKNTAKHPAIPLLINELDNHINILKTSKLELADARVESVDENDSRNVTQIENVDMDRVRTAVLWFINEARVARGKDKYVWSDRLNSTAQDRSDALRKRNWWLGWAYPVGWTHWRNSQSEWYFNSDVIGKWFADRGVTTRFTESNAYWWYSCSWWDCTEKMIASVKKAFDRFMSEEISKWPHYTSMTASWYDNIWMWLTVEDNYKVWIVFHLSQKD